MSIAVTPLSTEKVVLDNELQTIVALIELLNENLGVDIEDYDSPELLFEKWVEQVDFDIGELVRMIIRADEAGEIPKVDEKLFSYLCTLFSETKIRLIRKNYFEKGMLEDGKSR